MTLHPSLPQTGPLGGPTDPLAGRRVVVLGLARQGKALARWLPTLGARVTVSDSRSAEALAATLDELAGSPVQFVLGGHPLDLLDDCDLLCLSGGVPPTLPIVQEAYRRGIRVANDAQLFMERCPAPVLGITGSAGKTTTTALTGLMARLSGRRTWVGGNIGDVLLDVLSQIAPGDLVVMELSSFQLELMTTSPTVAAVLNVTPNHLDRHGTMEAYAGAKAHIFLHQRPGDVAIFGCDDPVARQLSRQAPAGVAYFSRETRVTPGAYLAGNQLVLALDDRRAEVVAPRSAVRLRGEHNISNVLAACAVAGFGGVPVPAMRAALEEFTGVEHRLELVAERDGVAWVNDSIATAPERVIAALRSYREPVVLLAGGRDKKLPWDEMAALAARRCRAVIAFGEYGPAVVEHMRAALARETNPLLSQVIAVRDLPEAVARAAALAQPGDVVLLSPGGTSYDAYVDFAARGQHFRDLVRALVGS